MWFKSFFAPHGFGSASKAIEARQDDFDFSSSYDFILTQEVPYAIPGVSDTSYTYVPTVVTLPPIVRTSLAPFNPFGYRTTATATATDEYGIPQYTSSAGDDGDFSSFGGSSGGRKSSSKAHLPGGAWAGIVVSILVVLALFALQTFLVLRRRRRQKRQQQAATDTAEASTTDSNPTNSEQAEKEMHVATTTMQMQQQPQPQPQYSQPYQQEQQQPYQQQQQHYQNQPYQPQPQQQPQYRPEAEERPRMSANGAFELGHDAPHPSTTPELHSGARHHPELHGDQRRQTEMP